MKEIIKIFRLDYELINDLNKKLNKQIIYFIELLFYIYIYNFIMFILYYIN